MTPLETFMLAIVKTYDGPDSAILQIEPPFSGGLWFARLVIVEPRRDYVVGSGRATSLEDAVASLARLRGVALPSETPRMGECEACGGTGLETHTCGDCAGHGTK